MKRAWLSDPRSRLGRAAARGLKALGWKLADNGDAAEARVILLNEGDRPGALPGGTAAIVLVTSAGDRLAVAALSLETQRLAVAAAPDVRVNAVVVEEGYDDQLGATIDWLIGAEMVTGQLVRLGKGLGE